jgi:hypothetical protein
MQYDRFIISSYAGLGSADKTDVRLFRDEPTVPQEWLDPDGFVDEHEASLAMETLNSQCWNKRHSLDESTARN